ncbi:hypothetical protein MMC29_001185 [Sticta canariensis]|nr:hypothetical protein [Sticta canariensis]
MDNRETIVTHHAILIGIDAYTVRPLTSCVHDVQEIKKHLESVLLNSVHIQMLTAPNSTILESDTLAEGSVLWPTHDNVISAFKKTYSLAKAGDFLYIHYSGHGTRAESGLDRQFSNRFTGDLALVLLEKEEEYLRGWILANWLKAMVDKGLVVTLVLDCCFSATVVRDKHEKNDDDDRDDDPTIRSLPYDAEIDSKYPMTRENSPGNGADYFADRDVSMRPNWLINPDGYAIIVACGPHELAKGITYDGQSYGALSFFLLGTFKEYGGLRRKNKNIYSRLCARFLKDKPQQNPVLFGNKNQGFFGKISSEIDTNPVSIFRDGNGNLQLQAGQAHGVCDKDLFTLHPLGSVESNLNSKGEPLIAKVTQVRALTSYVELLETTSGCDLIGWIAQPRTRAFHQKFPIRLDSSLPYRDEWCATLNDRSLVNVDIDEHSFSFHALLNSCNEYEILDESGHKIINLPTMSRDQADVSSVCDILEHLGRYQRVEALANKTPADAFMESFKVQIVGRSGEIFDPECVVETEHSEQEPMFELRVVNKGSKSLYVFVYDMSPCWQIENIIRASYEVIPPRNRDEHFQGMFTKRLRTVVPDQMQKKGHHECQDIIKVFVASVPTSFDLLELPKAGESAKTKTPSRESQAHSDVPEEWVALNFPIRTTWKYST